MATLRPIYKKLLAVAVVIYVVGVCVMLSDIYQKIGLIEDTLVHMQAGHQHKH